MVRVIICKEHYDQFDGKIQTILWADTFEQESDTHFDSNFLTAVLKNLKEHQKIVIEMGKI